MLAEIGAGDMPQLLVFNKIDRLDEARCRGATTSAARPARERLWLSARTGAGLELLREALARRFGDRLVAGECSLAPAQGRLRARLHRAGRGARGTRRRAAAGACDWSCRRAVAERLAEESGGQLLASPLACWPRRPYLQS